MSKRLTLWYSLLTLASAAAVRWPTPAHVGAITVGRIDIADADGTTRITVTNKEQMPSAVIDGVTRPRDIELAGILYYGPDGAETGGLGTTVTRDGDDVALFTNDYARSDATSFGRGESAKGSSAGLGFNDPTPPGAMTTTLGKERIALGVEAHVSALELKDRLGRPRIRLAVDEHDVPSIAILDDRGQPTARVP